MDISIIKKHLCIEHDLDDTLISSYAIAAESAISSYIHSAYEELNPTHNQAKLLIIASWYATRENEIIGSTVSDMSLGIKFLLDMEKRMPI